MADFRSLARVTAGTVAAAALTAITVPAIASAAPNANDAALARTVGCDYAASVARFAANAGASSSRGKILSERNGIYVIQCEVRVSTAKPGTATTLEEGPAQIYRVTVDSNNRFFVVNAQGPNVPKVRVPGRAA